LKDLDQNEQFEFTVPRKKKKRDVKGLPKLHEELTNNFLKLCHVG